MGSPPDPGAGPTGPSGAGGDQGPAGPDRRRAAPDGGHASRAHRGPGALGRAVLLALGLVAALLVGLAAVMMLTGNDRVATPSGAGATGAPGPAAAEGAVADTLPLARLAGFGGEGPVEIADYRGTPVLVNFWATWCPPCVDEMPAVQAVHEDVGQRVAFLGVNVRDAPANAEALAKELGISYDLAVDAEGDYYREVGARGMPTTLLVAPDGRIVARHTGPLTARRLRELLGEKLGVTP